MDNTIRIPLDLPDVQIQAVSQSEQGDWLIRVESKNSRHSAEPFIFSP